MKATTKMHTLRMKIKPSYLLTGVLLVLVWPVAASAMPQDFFCNLLQPRGCSSLNGLKMLFIVGPAAIGAVLIPVGFLYNLKLDRSLKTLIVLPVAAVLCYISFYVAVFATISFHGL